MEIIATCFKEVIETFKKSQDSLGPAILEAAESCYNVLIKGNKILFCGNGGSSVDVQHLATELVVRLDKKRERAPLAALALTSSVANITAIGNDYSFEDIFSRQIEALGNRGDLLIAMSTSGNSPNIIKALSVATSLGMTTLLFSGMTGGEAIAGADLAILVPSSSVMRIQEVHLFAGHAMIQLLEDLFLCKQG